MEEPVTTEMKDLVISNIDHIANEHQQMILGWRSVTLNNENILHLHNLFTKCTKQDIRIFENANFLGEDINEVYRLLTTRLTHTNGTQCAESSSPESVADGTFRFADKEPETEDNADFENDESRAPLTEVTHNYEPREQNKHEQLEQQEIDNEPSAISENENATAAQKSKKKRKKKDKKEVKKENNKEAEKEKEDTKENETVLTQQSGETQYESEELVQAVQDKKDKRVNPFDNDNCIVEPLITSKPILKAMDEFDDSFNTLDCVTGNYINPESNTLKSNLQRLATDISAEEQNVRAKMESGVPVSIDNGVLADFIARANNVLKETEAVTVRKIAEAETRKFLSSVNVSSEPCFESISNELMQDIWPKTNEWRDIARIKCRAQSPEEPVSQATKKKLEEQLERTVRAAIKSAGEPLDKRQIGRIRKAAVIYRDFDAKEARERQFRSDQTVKLVELVSAYEATNQMDELTRLRLAIAFCTKRRDHFLKARPYNFMQFSYMYIYLLEKINSKTAAICACLNYHKTLETNFDELEELVLNLFHEDFFLSDTGA